MRFFTIVASTALVALSSAQQPNLGDLPKCAQGCVGNSLGNTGCNNLQVKCICEQSNWISGLSCCVEKACSPEDQAKTISFAGSICKATGVNVPTSASEACHGSHGGAAASSGTPSGTAKASTAVSSIAKAATGTGAANRDADASILGLAVVAGFAALI